MGHTTHCISCECEWGTGEDVETSGICPKCFAKWVQNKSNLNCYGEFGYESEEECINCFVSNLCLKDTYGI